MTETSRLNRACAGSGSIWVHSSSDLLVLTFIPWLSVGFL
jgi:hypothetical protein